MLHYRRSLTDCPISGSTSRLARCVSADGPFVGRSICQSVGLSTVNRLRSAVPDGQQVLDWLVELFEIGDIVWFKRDITRVDKLIEL